MRQQAESCQALVRRLDSGSIGVRCQISGSPITDVLLRDEIEVEPDFRYICPVRMFGCLNKANHFVV